MDGYLSKPVQAAKLFAAIERQVEALRGITRLERPGDRDGKTVSEPLA
jgi:hypothetical protein